MRNLGERLSVRQRVGGALATLSALLTVLLAVLGSQVRPPSTSAQGLIASFAILAQIGSAWVFSGEGKADPGLAKRSVGRLLRLAGRTHAARRRIEALQESGASAADLRLAIRELSVHFSYLEDGYVQAVEDWAVFHPYVVQEAKREDDDDN